MRNLVPIGRFSRLCRLTIPALRHYDELGLLRPALVDPDTGYRYYSPAQVAEAERIRLLRSIDMPLDEIRALLAERDPDATRARLELHRTRLTGRIDTYLVALGFLGQLIEQEAGPMRYDVEIRETMPQEIVSVRGHTSAAGMPAFFGTAYREIFGRLATCGIRPAGPGFTIYHDPEFREEDIDVEVCVPVGEPVETEGRIVGRTMCGGTIASTVHPGSYELIGRAYQALDEWVTAHGHEIAGPPREVYLVWPGATQNPAELRTEIDWPIR